MFLSFFSREVHEQGRDYGQIVICYVLQPQAPSPLQMDVENSKQGLWRRSGHYCKGWKMVKNYKCCCNFFKRIECRNLRKIVERNYGKYKRSTFFMADDNIVKGSGHKCYHLLQTQKRIGTDIVINICEYIRIINFSYKIKMQGKLSFGVKEYFVHLHNLV